MFALYIFNKRYKIINLYYNCKARKTGIKLNKFNNKKEEFNTWVIKLNDNFMKDTDTFKNERNRITVININIKGFINNFFCIRYDSLLKNLFKNIYEIIVTFIIVYFNNNQFFKI